MQIKLMGSRTGTHSIFGINTYLDWGWGFMSLLVVWGVADAVFQILHPQWGMVLASSLALIAAVLFFASVLAHELAHAWAALRNGIAIRGIKLFAFCGESSVRHEPMSPEVEMTVNLAGPLINLVLGTLFLSSAAASGSGLDELVRDAPQALATTPLATLLLWSGLSNLLLGAVNLIPVLPLDGGYVLRSLLWSATGNLSRSTGWAFRMGQWIAWVPVLMGISVILGIGIPFPGIGPVAGLGLAFTGSLLHTAAAQSRRQAMIQDLLRGVPVLQHLGARLPTVPPNIPVRNLITDSIAGSDDLFFPVVDNDCLVGLVCYRDVRQVPRERWDTTEVGEIMISPSQLAVIKPGRLT